MRFNTRYRAMVCKKFGMHSCPDLSDNECLNRHKDFNFCKGYSEEEKVSILDKDIFKDDRVFIETHRGTNLFTIERIYSLNGEFYLLPKNSVDDVKVSDITDIKLR